MGVRLTYANVMATAAVFVALGGSSYAALKITGRDVRDSSLTGKDVERLTGADVVDGSLRASDFAPGQLPRGQTGAPGAPGKDATNLFGYIREQSQGGNDATVDYGKGVVAVDDRPDKGIYFVTFDRSVTNCIVLATVGSGDPSGAVIGGHGSANVSMQVGPPEQVEVEFRDAGAGVDTPFMIAAFC